MLLEGRKYKPTRSFRAILVGPAPSLLPSEFFSSRTRATSREEKNLQGFLEQPKEKWVESAFEVDGPHYFTILALHVIPPEQWRAMRVEILRRLLVASHARAVAPGGATRSVLALGSCSISCLPVCFQAMSHDVCLLKVCSFDLALNSGSSWHRKSLDWCLTVA